MFFALFFSVLSSADQENCIAPRVGNLNEFELKSCLKLFPSQVWKAERREKIGRISNIQGDHIVFQRGVFSDAEFTKAFFSFLRIERSQLNKIAFIQSKLPFVHFIFSSAEGLKFEGTDLKGLRCVHSNMNWTSFRESRLNRGVFENCLLNYSDFRGADLRGVLFVLSPLKNAVFNNKTRLPFTRERALELGMKEVE